MHSVGAGSTGSDLTSRLEPKTAKKPREGLFYWIPLNRADHYNGTTMPPGPIGSAADFVLADDPLA